MAIYNMDVEAPGEIVRQGGASAGSGCRDQGKAGNLIPGGLDHLIENYISWRVQGVLERHRTHRGVIEPKKQVSKLINMIRSKNHL